MAAGIYEDAKFAQDILDAWYNALPKYLKEPGLRPDQKALALYRNYDKIDIQIAILGVLIAVAGEKAGAYIDKATTRWLASAYQQLDCQMDTGLRSTDYAEKSR